jgi:hypothetical protein
MGGAALGMGMSWAFNKSTCIMRAADRVLRLSESYPNWFYTAFFLVTYQITVVFHDLRNLIKGLIKFLRLFIG